MHRKSPLLDAECTLLDIGCVVPDRATDDPTSDVAALSRAKLYDELGLYGEGNVISGG
jgi:hypothetical protein